MRRFRRLRHRTVIAGMSATMVLGGGAALAAGGAGHTHRASAASLLTAGAQGSTVKALQHALGIAADGVYGPRTRHAVRAFQARHGLEVDGIAGPQTLGALGLADSSSTSAHDTPAVSPDASSVLGRIAACESGGNAAAVSADGVHRGKYQFDRATWASVGGTGDPAAAPESEQDRLAAILYSERGVTPWPQCGPAAAQ
jgi:hypothetical protein